MEDTNKFEEEKKMEERKNKICAYIGTDDYLPLNRDELSVLLDVPKNDRPLFKAIIDELIKEGKILETKKGKLVPLSFHSIVRGTFISNARGFGFVETEDPKQRDIFIPPEKTGNAMFQDQVLCRVISNDTGEKRSEGEIIRVIERGKSKIVGTFQESKSYGFVTPDEKKIAYDIFVSKENTKGAVTGHKVVVQLLKGPENGKNPEGKVIEILGHINDPGVDILSVIRQFDLPVEFPKEVYDQVESIPNCLTEEDLIGREDLRSWDMVTIDGEDAKDLDDAVSLTKTETGNYLLGVHIADVTNYVREGTPLDEEAYIRGTSIYLVDRVIPMLPHKLCNGICSLNPKEDRLTLSCIMEITPQGKVINHRITKSIICTNERMTYTDVNKIITEKDPELMKRYEPLVEMFLQMDELRKILNHRRKSRGSVNFELPEAKIVLDEAGHPTEIKPYEKNAATNLIEEFMLVCNETISENFYWQEVPFVYRNHENPDEEKAQQLKIFLSNLGYRIKGKGEIRPKALQKVLEESEGKPEEHIVSRVVLRSMKQAKYMADNLGHFGLAAKFYCHFTSPIRRYPDLQIHRIIKETLDGKMTPKRTKFLTRRLPDVAKQCSLRERVAVDAERETDRLKMVEFMSDKIGNVYEGIISGVTGWGIYVELPNTVEGMIYVNDLLDDHYIFEEKSMQYTGIHTKKVYRLGDTVRIKVLKADKEMKTIDFTFAENE